MTHKRDHKQKEEVIKVDGIVKKHYRMRCFVLKLKAGMKF